MIITPQLPAEEEIKHQRIYYGIMRQQKKMKEKGKRWVHVSKSPLNVRDGGTYQKPKP